MYIKCQNHKCGFTVEMEEINHSFGYKIPEGWCLDEQSKDYCPKCSTDRGLTFGYIPPPKMKRDLLINKVYCLELCSDYIAAIKNIEEFVGMNIYGIDNQRIEIHDELCKAYVLSKEETLPVTNHINLEDRHCVQNLFKDLLKVSEQKEVE